MAVPGDGVRDTLVPTLAGIWPYGDILPAASPGIPRPGSTPETPGPDDSRSPLQDTPGAELPRGGGVS
jgi:hypothetical protein